MKENENAGLKLNTQKTKIMASGPITWKQGQTLFSWFPKSLQMVTAAMKLKKNILLLWRKAMTNLDSILQSRDITWPTKVCLIKAMVFPVVKYGCESWTIRRLSTEELMLSNSGVGEAS